jgi:hypothetical protein
VTSPGGEQFDVAWMVKSRRGAIVGQFTQAVRIPPEPGTPILEARQTSEQVAVAMGLTDSPGVAPTQGSYKAKSTLPTISVKPVEGASGDGRDSLRLAVLQALTDGGLKRDDIDPDVNVTCFIDAKAHDIASQEVRITWHAVLRDGQELGVLHLENIVPNGTLDGSWGPTAFAIAAAAQPDLVKLINTQIKR